MLSREIVASECAVEGFSAQQLCHPRGRDDKTLRSRHSPAGFCRRARPRRTAIALAEAVSAPATSWSSLTPCRG